MPCKNIIFKVKTSFLRLSESKKDAALLSEVNKNHLNASFNLNKTNIDAWLIHHFDANQIIMRQDVDIIHLRRRTVDVSNAQFLTYFYTPVQVIPHFRTPVPKKL